MNECRYQPMSNFTHKGFKTSDTSRSKRLHQRYAKACVIGTIRIQHDWNWQVAFDQLLKCSWIKCHWRCQRIARRKLLRLEKNALDICIACYNPGIQLWTKRNWLLAPGFGIKRIRIFSKRIKSSSQNFWHHYLLLL